METNLLDMISEELSLLDNLKSTDTNRRVILSAMQVLKLEKAEEVMSSMQDLSLGLIYNELSTNSMETTRESVSLIDTLLLHNSEMYNSIIGYIFGGH